MDEQAILDEIYSIFISGSLFHAIHGGLLETQGLPAYGDPELPRAPAAYVEEAVAKGHFHVGPAPGAEPPEVIFHIFGNLLRSCRMGHRLVDSLFAKSRLVVDVTFRVGETSRHSDILLPAAAWYEKISIKYNVTLCPYITFGDRAVPPLGESKPEWEIFGMLAERVGAEARRRGISSIKGFRGDDCRIDNLGERFTDGGRFGAEDEEGVLRHILKISRASRGITIEDLRSTGGAVRVSNLAPDDPHQGTYCEYRKDEPIVPFGNFVDRKEPYPTLSGRQQFYVDHPWFLEVGEELPTHKPPPLAGGDYPFSLTAGHARWSLHSNQRDHAMMLRLQRGEPVVYINNEFARSQGIADHDLIEVWNDVGSFVARARLTGGVHPRQLHMLHGWEPFQFRGGRSHQSLHPSPIKVTQLVGDYGQLHYGLSYYDPGQTDRDTRVNVRKA
jgi:anaerobic selenocysteine-containing dehydrogenase